MKIKITTALICASMTAASAHAATINWDGGGADSLWDTALNWDDDAVPATGNDYFVDSTSTAYTIEAPTGTSTFAGDSLTVQNGSTLQLDGVYTINNLAISDSTLLSIANVTLNQDVAFSGACAIDTSSASTSSTVLEFAGALTGSGSLNISRDDSASAGRFLQFQSSTAGYSGDITLSSTTTNRMYITPLNSNGWGTGELAIDTYGQITFQDSVTVNTTGTINLTDTTAFINPSNAHHTIGGLTILGNTVAAGTYTGQQLADLGFGGEFRTDKTGTLTIVPEPASMALLGLGGLILLRRRRRHTC